MRALWSMIDDDSLYRSKKKKPQNVDLKSCGRYAASTLNIAGTVVMAGGMVSCSGDHTVTTSVRKLRKDRREVYWEGYAFRSQKIRSK